MPSLCVHGHFYQPPRFDPWLDEVLPESSAAPFHNWNERINRECYEPLAFARRMDSRGFIFKIINCYEYISFNFGPTLLTWMEKHSPATYERILAGDRASIEKFGRGNAMAQVYHHVIMPLSTEHDRRIEIQWSIIDFEHRYGRRPEGMWLAETAVCTDTLESLAEAGILFTILAPRQARAVAGLDSEQWHEVDETSLDTDQPYLVQLPSGRKISVFFYDGPASQAVAFEQLLSSGEQFWQRLVKRSGHPLLSLATDGESYGHHFKFGEMALAFALEQADRQESPLKLTNYASFLKDNPPKMKVIIREKTSWSCIHGIERWQDDCGCTDGGHPGWNQTWRRPLRRALNLLKYYIDEHYRRTAPEFFRDPGRALLDYGRCLCGAEDKDTFLGARQKKKLGPDDRIRALKLLESQRVSLASFASCAWFFDDITRIEPLNGLSYALRGMEMLKDLGGPDLEPEFTDVLEDAFSNDKRYGDGKAIWNELVLPRRITPAQMAVAGMSLEETGTELSFTGLRADLERSAREVKTTLEWTRTGERARAGYAVLENPDNGPGIVVDNQPFTLADLDKRLKNYILSVLNTRIEDRIREQMKKIPRVYQDLLGMSFEEGQDYPLGGTGPVWPGAVLGYLKSDRNCPDLEKFWTEIFKYNPFQRQIMENSLTREINRLTDLDGSSWSAVGQLVRRAKALGLYPDLFQAQNRLWHHAHETDKEILENFFLYLEDSHES